MNIVKGDLLELAESGEFDVIVHGCNCFCVMGAGIARQIRGRYPGAAKADRLTVRGDQGKLGSYTLSTVISRNSSTQFVVINAYTQYYINGHNYHNNIFDTSAFKEILDKLLIDFPYRRFGFPMIGTGLAGGDKKQILEMIEDFSNKAAVNGGTVTVVEYQKNADAE